jgi:hypothetical protein
MALNEKRKRMNKGRKRKYSKREEGFGLIDFTLRENMNPLARAKKFNCTIHSLL